jgi:hypothetical protein
MPWSRRSFRSSCFTNFAPPATSAPDCGSRLFATGELAQLRGQFYAIHVPKLDDLDWEELVRAPMNFIDNAHDLMDRPPADTRLM